MSKDQKKKTPIYPWDSISCILAAIISFGVVMGVMRIDSLLVVGIVLVVLALLFEVIAYAAFPKQIAKYKEKVDAAEREKEREKQEKALTLKPHEQAFYDKFTRVLATLTEKQFKEILGYHVGIMNAMKKSKIMYAENKAFFDVSQAKKHAVKGNAQNYQAVKAYCEELMQATGTFAQLKKNMPVKGPEFGVITTNAADAMLYGAIVESDIKKQVRRNDVSTMAYFEDQVVKARTKLFSKVKL